MSIQADVGSTLVALNQLLKQRQYKVPDEWVDSLRSTDEAKEAANSKKSLETSSDGNLNPLLVLEKLDHSLPDDVILVADGGDFVGSAAYIVRFVIFR